MDQQVNINDITDQPANEEEEESEEIEKVDTSNTKVTGPYLTVGISFTKNKRRK